jgi:hypothetical protein
MGRRAVGRARTAAPSREGRSNDGAEERDTLGLGSVGEEVWLDDQEKGNDSEDEAVVGIDNT